MGMRGGMGGLWGETEVSFESGGELQARITHFSAGEREHPHRLLLFLHYPRFILLKFHSELKYSHFYPLEL